MLTKEILEEAEFAKNHLMNSALDDRCKKSLLRLLNIATQATNGISTDEKIQKITEAFQGLVMSQITFLDAVDKKIEQANREKCASCKAMIHAENVETEDAKKKLIEDWKLANGITDEDIHRAAREDEEEVSRESSWASIIKKIVAQPGIWVFLTLLTISPYGVDIVKAILQFF